MPLAPAKPSATEPNRGTRPAGGSEAEEVVRLVNVARAAAAAVMDAWMHSPGHRADIRNCGFTEIGVGVGTDGGPWWNKDFGTPSLSPLPTEPPLRPSSARRHQLDAHPAHGTQIARCRGPLTEFAA